MGIRQEALVLAIGAGDHRPIRLSRGAVTPFGKQLLATTKLGFGYQSRRRVVADQPLQGLQVRRPFALEIVGLGQLVKHLVIAGPIRVLAQQALVGRNGRRQVIDRLVRQPLLCLLKTQVRQPVLYLHQPFLVLWLPRGLQQRQQRFVAGDHVGQRQGFGCAPRIAVSGSGGPVPTRLIGRTNR